MRRLPPRRAGCSASGTPISNGRPIFVGGNTRELYSVILEPRRKQPPRRGRFCLNLISVRADVFMLGKFQGPVSIRSAASEHIPLGGAVLLRISLGDGPNGRDTHRPFRAHFGFVRRVNGLSLTGEERLRPQTGCRLRQFATKNQVTAVRYVPAPTSDIPLIRSRRGVRSYAP